jgi:hypothetical protein
MSRRTLSSLAGLGALLLAAGALAGCATGGPAPAITLDPSETAAEEVAVDAAWLDGGASVAVLLEGSSTCVPMADDVRYADGVLSVSMLEPSSDTACTRDLVLRGVPVALPADVDPTQDLRIDVVGDGYTGTTDLAGAEGATPGAGAEEGTPSAGWASAAGTFALLTYGSSSCRPQVQDAAVAAPGQIAVTFATPPADQVCTADYAPRVTVVTVADVETGTAYSASLTGEGFEATPVVIAGVPA